VGWALHKNPYYGEVPCHRVVNRNGEISSGFAFGGPFEQKKMLEKEGIIFDENGKINLNNICGIPMSSRNDKLLVKFYTIWSKIVGLTSSVQYDKLL